MPVVLYIRGQVNLFHNDCVHAKIACISTIVILCVVATKGVIGKNSIHIFYVGNLIMHDFNNRPISNKTHLASAEGSVI